MPTTLPRPRKRSHAAVQFGRRIAITFVIDNLSRAGTETQLLALIRLLDRSRFEPRLILLDGGNVTSRELEPSNCEVVRLGVQRLFSRAATRAAAHIRELWRQSRPDILQAYFLDASYFSVPLARWCNVPHVVRVRNNLGYWLTRKHKILNRLIRPWVDVTLTNSEVGGREIGRQDGIEPGRIAVIENGVDLTRFTSVQPPTFGETIRVGCVANLRTVKNIDGLMRAACRVLKSHPNVIFEIAGDGEERPALESLHRELNLGDRFRLLGSVSDVPDFLRTLDVAVLPSHSEGMSNALLEYMAAGRAIVATDTGANGKLVQHQRQGLIVPPNREPELADAVASLIGCPTKARELAASARVRVACEYSREGMKRRFEEFYSRLVFQAK